MSVSNRIRGATLVELLVSIVIVSVAAGSVLGVLALNAGASADPMHRYQATAVAEAYLEEIMLRPIDDPDGFDAEAARANFDDVDDYNGLVDLGAADQFGVPIATLADYEVRVSVSGDASMPGVSAADALRVDVRVTRDRLVDYVLTGYRLRY